jgi:hypothetical protein
MMQDEFHQIGPDPPICLSLNAFGRIRLFG